MRYTSNPRVQAADSEGEVVVALREGLLANREADERRGFTGFGPQTDDLELELAGHLAARTRVSGSASLVGARSQAGGAGILA